MSQARSQSSTFDWVSWRDRLLLITLFFAGSGALTNISSVPSVRANLQHVVLLIWLSAYLFAVAWAFTKPGALIFAVVRNPSVTAWPLIACLSFIWSLDPNRSLYDGIQLLMTVAIGFFIAYRFDLNEILWALFWTLLAAAALSAFNIATNVPIAFFRGGHEWQGVFAHKNVLGGVAITLIITALALPNKRQWLGLFFLSVTLAFVLLVGSRSATAIVTAVIVAPLFIASFLSRAYARALPIFVGLSLIGAACSVFVILVANIDPIGIVTDALGKNRNLTGRTILWEFGVDAFWDKPWVGHGYKAYWACCETTAGDLKLTIKQRLKSFHNNYLDVGVSFGFVGLTVFVAALAVAFWRSLRVWLYMRATQYDWLFLMTLVLLARTTVEYPLFANHGLYQLLFVIILTKSYDILRMLDGKVVRLSESTPTARASSPEQRI